MRFLSRAFWTYAPRLLSLQMRYQVARRRLRRSHRNDLENLSSSASKEVRESLNFRHETDWRALHATQEGHFTQQLLKKARRLHVPVPSGVEFWTTGPFHETRYLTPEGIAIVRARIRDEERWNLERRKHRIQWLAALSGLVGACTGFLAVALSVG